MKTATKRNQIKCFINFKLQGRVLVIKKTLLHYYALERNIIIIDIYIT